MFDYRRKKKSHEKKMQMNENISESKRKGRIKMVALKAAQIVCGLLAGICLIVSIDHEPLLFLTLSSTFLTCSAWLIWIQDPNGYSMFLAGRFKRWIIGSETYKVPNIWVAIFWSILTLFLWICYLVAVLFRPS